MQDLEGRTAVVTGAASGFGRELSILCAAAGMNLVLADRDEPGMQATGALLPAGSAWIAERTDVARPADLDRLAERAWARFGGAHLLFNNAGVAVAGPAWTATLEDWKWCLDVNLMGVVHGIRSFVPRMLAQGGPAHVVNTASVAGLLSVPGSAVYCVSKHGVVTLSECLHQDLRLSGSAIGVSVLCPAFVNTGIGESQRNRPAELASTNPLCAPYEARVKKALRAGRLTAADVARATLEAVRADRFYILTHPAIKPSIEARMRDILDDRAPTNPMP